MPKPGQPLLFRGKTSTPEVLLAFAGGAAVATAALILVFTFHYRVNRYVNWMELEHLGQFWSGVFSPLALFALIASLYYQQRQIEQQTVTQNDDRQHFDEQMQLLRVDHTQKSFELACDQLRDYAEELMFQETSTNGTAPTTEKGLTEIVRLLEGVDEDDLLDHVVLDRTQLGRYLRMAQSVESLLVQLPENLRATHMTQFEQLHPGVLDKVAQQLDAERNQSLRWIRNEFSKEADAELRIELETYVEKGWAFARVPSGQDMRVVANCFKPGAYRQLQSRPMSSLAECCREVMNLIRHTITSNGS